MPNRTASGRLLPFPALIPALIPALVAMLVLPALLAALVLPAGPAAAEADVVLADFETADALDGVTLPAPDVDRARVAEEFASVGGASMRFDIGAFTSKAGSVFPRVWLSVGSTVPDVDWSQHNYLHVGVANGSTERANLYLVIWDKAGRFLQRSVPAAPFEYHVFQVRVADIAAAGVDLTELDRIQLSSERSANPKRMYADDIRLTDEPTDLPAERARVAPALIELMELSGAHQEAADSLADVRRRISSNPAAPDRALRTMAATIADRLEAYADRIGSIGSDDMAVAEARAIWSGLVDVSWEVRRLSTLVDARAARPNAPIGLGFADSMTRVYPRDLPCDCAYGPSELTMVRGEHESIQLVAMPYAAALADAEVRATVVNGRTDISVAAHPVVSLNMVPPVDQRPATPTAFRPSIYEGWTPDPIQTGDSTVDVVAGDVQAFWIAVETAANARAGTYLVDLELRADGIQPQRSRVRVRVSDVEIGAEPLLRTAIGHDPLAYAEPYGVTDPDEAAALVAGEYAFLGEYWLQGDNIYRSIYEGQPPSVERLRRIEQEFGGLRQFNVWYFDPRLFDLTAPETWAEQADQLFDTIQPHIDAYRAAGFVDNAYLYCCDETRAAHSELIKFVLTRFKERFPDIEVLTTAIDDTMGSTTGLGSLIDWWVRDVPWHDREIIADRHAEGLEAWWYLHQANANPTPNVFVNYDPGQLRVLLGPMSYWAEIDGFLYYRVDRWYGKGIVDDGPLSSWEPRTWGNWSGDGSLFYPGPDGPIPSIRLENLRDGLEDYNLQAALRTAIEQAPPGTDPRLLVKAQGLLGGSDVVTDNYEYVRNPEPYRRWRNDVVKTVAELR